MYDVIIIGGGPAGVAGGVYAARKRMKSALITDSFGGQSLVSSDIQNWIGETSLSGFDLGKKLENHLRAQEIGVFTEKVETIEKREKGFSVKTESGGAYETQAILLAAGSVRKKLNIPGEKEYEGKGVFYCSICDAPLMAGKRAAVVGGGNAGLEAVRDLLPYAERIYLLHRRDELKGDPVTAEAIVKNEKVEILYNALIAEIHGNNFVEGIAYRDAKSGIQHNLAVDGVFVEVGAKANSDLVQGMVETNERGEVVVNHKTQETSCEGVWAAGDVADVLYKQNNVSAGDAIKAVLNIYEYLSRR